MITQEQIEKINFLFNENDKILSCDLKEKLGFDKSNQGTLWGSLVSQLIAKKILKKTNEFQIKNGQKYYYYQLNKKDDENLIIVDNLNNIYSFDKTLSLKDNIDSILLKNPKLEISVYKKQVSYKLEYKSVEL